VSADHCPPLERLRLLAAGRLPEPEQVRLSAHVETCPACQAALARLAEETASDVVDRLRQAAAAATLPEALRPLRDAPPAPAPAEPESEPAAIVFPGPPSEQGPLGRLGDYHIQRELGRGTFGVVFKALDARLGRVVALKVLRPEFAAAGPSRARFEREARAAAAVRHEHVVAIHQVAATPDFPLPFLVMEYIDGAPLDAHLAREGPPPPATGAELVRQAALGLAAAHERGLVHRDVKPANILVEGLTAENAEVAQRNKEGRESPSSSASPLPSASSAVGPFRVKLTDFGLARATAAVGADARITMPGSVVGTPAYMSPEQISDPDAVDARSDVYSLGAVLYELLTGAPPFRGSPLMLLRQTLHEEPPPPRLVNERVPRDLETICLKCLRKEPAKRYPSARELADDLARWLRGEPVQARPIGAFGRFQRWCLRNPLVASLLAAVALALTAGAAVSLFFAFRYRDEAERAERNRQLAENQADQAHRNLHLAQVSLIQLAWEEGRIERAIELLRAQPEEGRGFDWYYWWRRCHSERSTLRGSPTEVWAVAFNRRGELLSASGQWRQPLRIAAWDAATGKPLPDPVPVQQTEQVRDLAFSADGRALAAATGYSGVRGTFSEVLVLEPGQQRRSLTLPAVECRTVAIAGRGREEGRGIRDQAFRFFSFPYPLSLFPLPSSWWVATAARTGPVVVWDTACDRPQWHLCVPGEVLALAFDDAGRRLAAAGRTSGRGHFLRVWNVADGTELAALDDAHPDRRITTLAFSHDGVWLAAGGDEGTILLWSPGRAAAVGQPRRLLRNRLHPAYVTALAFSHNGRTLASGDEGHAVQLWDLSGDALLELLKGHNALVRSVAFSADDRTLVSGSYDQTIKLWDVSGDQFGLSRQRHGDRIHALGFSPDGRWLASASADRTVRLWEAATGQPGPHLRGPASPLQAVAFSRAGLLAAGGEDGRLYLWGRDHEPLQGPIDLQEGVSALAFSPTEERLLAVGGARGLVQLREVGGAVRGSEQGHEGGVYRLAFATDGGLLASAGRDGVVRLWDRQLRHVGSWPEVPDRPILSVAFAPQGRLLAVGGDDRRVVLLDVSDPANPAVLEVFEGHSGRVFSVAFSADGRTLASAGQDRTIKLWGVESRQLQALLHDDPVLALAFSPADAAAGLGGSRILASGSADGLLRFWRAATPAEVEGR
jgi:WD40 repeat protein/serine/threonine protein kinase